MTKQTDMTLEFARGTIADAGRELARVVRQQEQAFMRHQKETLAKAAKLEQAASDDLAQARKTVAQVFAKQDAPKAVAEARCLAEGANAFECIAEALTAMDKGITTKIDDHVLFSDLAVRAMTEALVGTRRQIRDVADCLATGNPSLRSHVLHRCEDLSRLINHGASAHEERLIQGVCSQKASSIFVAMSDALKQICHHVNSVASLCPGEEP